MIILDGGLGRELKAMGAPSGNRNGLPLRSWSLHFVRIAHEVFIEGVGAILLPRTAMPLCRFI